MDRSDQTATAHAPQAQPETPAPFSLIGVIRTAIGGLLMGIANLIPGVSGGTMILAIGLYEEFIDSVADLSALRFSARRVGFLTLLSIFAGGAIIGLSGLILYLLFHYTVAMFALFIGLTLGGAPLLLRSLRPVRADVVIAVAAGVAVMIGVFMLKEGMGFPKNTGMDFVSGLVGSTTMVLPGISGSYMLLVMDQYDRVVGAVRDLKDGLQDRDLAAARASFQVVIPVGIGAVLGIIVLSNVLKLLLHRFHRATVGVLLGILLGSVLGLWPFTQAVGQKALEDRSLAEIQAYATRWRIPDVDSLRSREELIAHIFANWDRRTTPPIVAGDSAIAIVCVLIGFAGTFALSRLGRNSTSADRRPRPNPQL